MAALNDKNLVKQYVEQYPKEISLIKLAKKSGLLVEYTNTVLDAMQALHRFRNHATAILTMLASMLASENKNSGNLYLQCLVLLSSIFVAEYKFEQQKDYLHIDDTCKPAITTLFDICLEQIFGNYKNSPIKDKLPLLRGLLLELILDHYKLLVKYVNDLDDNL